MAGQQGGQEQVRKGSVCKVVTLDLFVKAAGNNFTLEFWGNSSGCRVMGECRRGVGLGGEGTSQPDRKRWGSGPILGEL